MRIRAASLKISQPMPSPGRLRGAPVLKDIPTFVRICRTKAPEARANGEGLQRLVLAARRDAANIKIVTASITAATASEPATRKITVATAKSAAAIS